MFQSYCENPGGFKDEITFYEKKSLFLHFFGNFYFLNQNIVKQVQNICYKYISYII